MNVQSIVINLDKGSFNVSFIPDSGLGLENYETINLFELEYYVNQLLLNGSGTGFFQMVRSENLITINKSGTVLGKAIYFLTTTTLGITTNLPLTSDAQLNSTSSYQSKTNAAIILNIDSSIQTNITFRLLKLSGGSFAADYAVSLNSGNAMIPATATDGGLYWNVTIPSITTDVDGNASVLINALVN